MSFTARAGWSTKRPDAVPFAEVALALPGAQDVPGRDRGDRDDDDDRADCESGPRVRREGGLTRGPEIVFPRARSGRPGRLDPDGRP